MRRLPGNFNPNPTIQSSNNQHHQKSQTTAAMSTAIPPPSKRQRREHLELTQTQQDVSAAEATEMGSFKARFVDGDGNQMADVIEIPLAHASEKNISLLLNTLLARVRLLCP